MKAARPRATVVAEPAEVRKLADEVRAAGDMAFDTEFMRERTYRARLCLVQVATPQRIFLIDPLERLDLGAVAELLADPGVSVVVHAGKQDFEIFYESHDVVPTAVFDVQVAAGFAGYGSSLPYGRLVEAVAGERIAKGESYTEWCRRPLTSAQLAYASDDVAYLLPAAALLRERLSRLGRLGWALEEMEPLEAGESYGSDPQLAWRKVTGRGSLTARQTAVLAELARWREETAARRDLPRGWVMKDVSLVEIARRQPQTVGELKAIRGVAEKEAQRSGRQILAAIERGRAGDAIPADRDVPREVQARASILAGLAGVVMKARCEQAGIASELVATRAELEGVFVDLVSGSTAGGRHRLLQGWRRELAGEAVLGLARGEIAVRVTKAPPYVEEVPL